MRTGLLASEAVAWPLAATGAFSEPEKSVDTHIDSFQRRVLDLRFQAREAAIQFRLTHPPSPSGWSPTQHLVPHARALLDGAGPRASLRLDPDEPGRELLRWRWASLALPPLLWVAAATDPELPGRDTVSLLHRTIAPTHPVSHQHLHAGAVFPFELLWSRLASHLDLAEIRGDGQAPALGATPGIPFSRWLVRAMVARRCLGRRLLDLSFGSFVGRRPPEMVIERALFELRTGVLTADSADDDRWMDAELARFARGERPSARPRTQRAVWELDPLWTGQPCPEACLLHLAIHRWNDLDREDRLIFAQYLRVKVALFRHLRSDPAEGGLPLFVQTYQRIRPYKSDLDQLGVEIALDEPELPLGAVEVRTSPDRSVDGILDLVAPRGRASNEPPKGDRPVEWGWILHLLRHSRRDHAPMLGREGRYQRRYRDHVDREQALARALLAWPQLLTVVRGLDLADDETSGPLWLALPSLMRLRALSERLANEHTWLSPLRLTLHAGEDYAHVLTGLRAIHEPLHWGLLREGDRIGHAIALGVQVSHWAAIREPIHMSRWDRLQDLLWVGEASERLGIRRHRDEIERSDEEICVLASEIWGTLGDLDVLRDLRALLAKPDTLDRMNLQSASRPSPPRGRAERLLSALLFDRAVATRANDEPILVSRALDQRVLGPLQRELRRRVAAARVTVELNPSSNLLVAQLDGLVDEPAFRLRSADPGRDDLVPLTLSADDPLSFSTRLADEYAYAWAGMVVGVHDGDRVGARYATNWLEEAARCSWRSRFTVDESLRLSELPVPGLGDRAWLRGG